MSTTEIRVLLIPIDGPVAFVSTLPGLEPMQQFVKGDSELPGYIEGVGYREGATAYGHEEGKYVHVHNPRGHAFLVDHFNHYNLDPIHGPIVVLGMTDEGDDTDIPDDLAQVAKALWTELV